MALGIPAQALAVLLAGAATLLLGVGGVINEIQTAWRGWFSVFFWGSIIGMAGVIEIWVLMAYLWR